MTLRKRITYWLLGTAAVVLTILLVLPYLIDSDTLKAKLQTTIERQAGGKVEFQQVKLSFLPRPSITLHQIKLDIPEQVQGTVGAIQVYPDLLALLSGQVRLAKLILESPEVVLNVTDAHTGKEKPSTEVTFSTLQNSLSKGLAPLVMAAPDLALVINNGTLTLNQGKQTLGLFTNLALKLELDVSVSGSLQAKLQGSVSDLTLHHNGHQESLEDLALSGTLLADEKMIALSIENLVLAKPGLQLKGDLKSGSASPAFEVDLQATGLDVDAIRKTALALAGDTSPTKEIFDYLRGGTVPQISFHSQGETASELGDLKNIVIKGHLQAGAVSIPEIDLDLTEVNGDVLIKDGVLEGSGMSTRLEGTSGHDGALKVALSEGKDLFQLELMLNADLAQAQHILKLIVENPDFVQQVDKITNLEGTSTGKLILGDSLTDINARVEITEMNLSADYQGLPFPISVTQGQLLFEEDQIELKDLNGSFGSSVFSGLACNIDLKDVLHLDLSSGEFGLVLNELYPWVASLDGAKESLAEIKEITGRLDLATLSFKGAVDAPEDWQLAATGAIKDLSIDTTRFPAKIELAKGDFTLDAEKLTFQNLKMDSLDADLILSGILKGFPQSLDQIEISLDGEMGQDSVAWLRGALEAPETEETIEAYTLRTPLTFSEIKILWQPDSTTSFKGNISIEKGPSLTLDVEYLAEQLQIKQLTVKDQYSDAKVAFMHNQDELSLNFAGILHHETLESLFINQQFGKGLLSGDFNVKVPLTKQTLPVAKGHLEGKGLVLPLPSGDKITIEQVVLVADGNQVKVDASTVTWNDFTWDPFNVTIDFAQEKIEARVTEAKLCGIDSSGLLTIAGKNLSLDFTFEGKGLDVASSYSCLTEGKVKMTGTLDFSGKISAQGEAEDLVSNMHGPLEMKLTKGSIEQSKLLARTLEVLNVTEIVKGKLPDLGSTGFAYSTITVQGAFKGEKLIIEKLFMDGDTLDVLGQGELDLEQETIDIELMAAPFKTVDTVVKYIPGVNYLLAGSLVTIPVSIKGNMTDPRIMVMSPSSVGSGLLRLGERIIKSPVKLIETLTPTKDKGKE